MTTRRTPIILGRGRRGATPVLSQADKDGLIAGLNIQTGAFIPTLVGSATAGALTYAYNDGYYWYNNGLCFVSGRMAWSAKGGIDGNVTVGGFPVRNGFGSQRRTRFNLQFYSGLLQATPTEEIIGYSNSGQSGFGLYKNGSIGGASSVLGTDLQDGGYIHFSGTYLTDAAPS